VAARTKPSGDGPIVAHHALALLERRSARPAALLRAGGARCIVVVRGSVGEARHAGPEVELAFQSVQLAVDRPRPPEALAQGFASEFPAVFDAVALVPPCPHIVHVVAAKFVRLRKSDPSAGVQTIDLILCHIVHTAAREPSRKSGFELEIELANIVARPRVRVVASPDAAGQLQRSPHPGIDEGLVGEWQRDAPSGRGPAAAAWAAGATPEDAGGGGGDEEHAATDVHCVERTRASPFKPVEEVAIVASEVRRVVATAAAAGAWRVAPVCEVQTTIVTLVAPSCAGRRAILAMWSTRLAEANHQDKSRRAHVTPTSATCVTIRTIGCASVACLPSVPRVACVTDVTFMVA